MDFKVIKTGGKQYIAKSGRDLRIEKLGDNMNVGDKISFDEVLLENVGGVITIGMPMITGAKVMATIKEITRDATIHVIKYMPKSRYYKKNGHRQPKMVVTID